MNKSEKIVPGCGNYDDARGICKLMFQEGVVPSLAQETQVNPPGEIEGPGIWTVPGLICIAAHDAERQETCSDHKPRTEQDDENDWNW